MRFRRRRSQHSVEPIDGTIIGDIDGPRAIIGSKGTLGALDGSWRFEWGAGAEDRWHIAHKEASARQTRVDDTPVFETSIRIPSGELMCRVGAVADGSSRSLMIEFRNDSPGAVALGCVLSLDGGSFPTCLSVDRTRIRADDRVLFDAVRRAGGVLLCHDDPWQAVAANPDQSSVSMSLDLTDRGGPTEAHAAMVFPLPHRASFVVRIPIDGQLPELGATLAEVAAGWRILTRTAATIEVPDRQLGEAWKRIVPDLVIAAGSTDLLTAAEAAPYLDLAGLHREADRARACLVIASDAGKLRGRVASTAISALASRDLRAGQESGIDRLIADLIADAGAEIDSSDLLMAAAVVRSTDQRLAQQLIGLHDAQIEIESVGIESRARELSSRVAKAAAAVVGHLISAVGRGGDANVDLLPAVPEHWFGQPLDVRGLDSHAGRISFSVRWHGSRPALLWDREGGPDDSEITCSGLDPAWSSTDRRGEALLSSPDVVPPRQS